VLIDHYYRSGKDLEAEVFEREHQLVATLPFRGEMKNKTSAVNAASDSQEQMIVQGAGEGAVKEQPEEAKSATKSENDKEQDSPVQEKAAGDKEVVSAPLESRREAMKDKTNEDLLLNLDDPANMEEWMARLLDGCGDICRYDIEGKPSLMFDYIEKKVDCPALMSNAAIDTGRPMSVPVYKDIPSAMVDAFLYGGKVKLDHTVYDQRYSGQGAAMPVWTEEEVNSQKEKCLTGDLTGSYTPEVVATLLSAIKKADVTNASVLVLGSERPWVEACSLAAGAKDVLTVEYGSIDSKHPQVKAVTPDQLRENWKDYVEKFDVVVTYSSTEHSGLGRYGDALNPWGDRQAIARAWCMTKPKGRLVIGTPIPGVFKVDYVNMNVHRLYGKVMHPHLLANWQQVWGSEIIDDNSHRIFILEK